MPKLKIGACDPGIHYGFAVYTDGKVRLHSGKQTGTTRKMGPVRKDNRLRKFVTVGLPAWLKGVPHWIVELPVAKLYKSKATGTILGSRSSGVSLALTAGAIVAMLRPAETLEWVPPGSWNYRGRGLQNAQDVFDDLHAKGRVTAEAAALFTNSEDVRSAFGILLSKLWREELEVTDIHV